MIAYLVQQLTKLPVILVENMEKGVSGHFAQRINVQLNGIAPDWRNLPIALGMVEK